MGSNQHFLFDLIRQRVNQRISATVDEKNAIARATIIDVAIEMGMQGFIPMPDLDQIDVGIKEDTLNIGNVYTQAIFDFEHPEYTPRGLD